MAFGAQTSRLLVGRMTSEGRFIARKGREAMGRRSTCAVSALIVQVDYFRVAGDPLVIGVTQVDRPSE